MESTALSQQVSVQSTQSIPAGLERETHQPFPRSSSLPPQPTSFGLFSRVINWLFFCVFDFHHVIGSSNLGAHRTLETCFRRIQNARSLGLVMEALRLCVGFLQLLISLPLAKRRRVVWVARIFSFVGLLHCHIRGNWRELELAYYRKVSSKRCLCINCVTMGRR